MDSAPHPPRPGLPVTVVLDDLRLRARVEREQGDDLELSVPNAPPPLRRPGAFDLRLEFVAERGPCRLLGQATSALGDADRDPRIRFTPTSNPQLLLVNEKVRAPIEMSIEVDAGNGPVTRRTRDLRGGGALVSGPLQVEDDAEVTYALKLPGRTDPVRGTARVARVTDEGDVALQLLELDEADFDDIILAAFEVQRAKGA